MKKIGLFPLKLVLFPESVIPLHIFEDRYKNLISECKVNDSLFGINFQTSSMKYDVGCQAEITDIIKEYDDGRLDIIITGRKRYKLIDSSIGEHGFLVGDVDEFEDRSELLDESLVTETIEIFNQIAIAVKSVHIDKIRPEALKTDIPSFFVAQKSGLSYYQKQAMIEMTSENERLTFLLDHFRKVKPMIKEAEFLNQLVKNNGYYKPKFYNP